MNKQINKRACERSMTQKSQGLTLTEVMQRIKFDCVDRSECVCACQGCMLIFTYRGSARSSLPARLSVLIHHLTVVVLCWSCPHSPQPGAKSERKTDRKNKTIRASFLTFTVVFKKHLRQSESFFSLNITQLAHGKTLVFQLK